MPFNDAFLANPEDFCTPSPAGQGKILIIAERDAVTPQLKATGYHSVKKQDRVSYCQINQGVSIRQLGAVTIEPGSNAYVAEIRSGPPDARDYGNITPNWFPLFYLPWQGGQTFRMTLKQPAGFRTTVRVFVTSTVDGCSAIVEGTPETPTVYHLNDMGGNPPGPTLALQQAYWTPKKTTMEGRFQAARSPKAVRQQAATPGVAPLPAAKGVHAMDYMDVMETQKAAADTGQDHHVHRADVMALRPNWVHLRHETSFYKPYGTVFGWKQNTTWRFFYQKRAVIFYRYRVTLSNGKTEAIDIARQIGWHLEEFWPGGSGIAVAKALVP